MTHAEAEPPHKAAVLLPLSQAPASNLKAYTNHQSRIRLHLADLLNLTDTSSKDTPNPRLVVGVLLTSKGNTARSCIFVKRLPVVHCLSQQGYMEMLHLTLDGKCS